MNDKKRKANRRVFIGKDTILSDQGEVLAEYPRFREQANKTKYVTMYLDDENIYEAYRGLGSLGMVWGYVMKRFDHESCIFHFSTTVKDDIIAVTGLSIGTVRAAVKSYTETNMLIRIVGSEYLVNPTYFYKGAWDERQERIDYYNKIKKAVERK